MLSFLLTSGLLAVVSGQATRCCMPTQWSATMTDIREVSKGNKVIYILSQSLNMLQGKVSSQLYYDYDNKAIAIQFFRFSPKTENLTRIVTKYSQNVRYSIQPDGTCTSIDVKGEVMLPNCIPASASYLGSNYIGEPTTGLKYDGWTIPLGNLTLTISFSDPGCVPITEGLEGSVTSGPVDNVYFFNGYQAGSTTAAFDVPAGC